MFKEPDPDTFKGKVYLNAIDKLIFGSLAAIILLIFQFNAHEFQLVQDASVSVSKIYTGIILEQREAVIKLMANYYLLIEDVKSGKPLNDKQKDEIKEYLHQIRFIMYTLCGVIPESLAESEKKKIKEAGKSFEEAISEMSLFLLGREEPSLKEIEVKADQLSTNYLILLESLRKMSIIIVKSEIKAAHKQK